MNELTQEHIEKEGSREFNLILGTKLLHRVRDAIAALIKSGGGVASYEARSIVDAIETVFIDGYVKGRLHTSELDNAKEDYT